MVVNRGKRIVISWNCKKEKHEKCSGILYQHEYAIKHCECRCHDPSRGSLDDFAGDN